MLLTLHWLYDDITWPHGWSHKYITTFSYKQHKQQQQLECGPMPNVMVTLPNIGGAFCSTPQSLADAPTR